MSKKIRPFFNFCIENFPFIEATYEAMDNYELWCLVVKKLNEVVDNTNKMGEIVDNINNYFINLNVQSEINNKLDDMAESGELTEIIAQYLQLAGVLSYNTVNDMKNANNLINGSIAKTLGYSYYNDNLGSFYKIRTITSEDLVDEINIISLSFDNTLIAEKINQDKIVNTVFIGDSYTEGYSPDGNVTSGNRFWELFAKMLNIKNYQGFYKGGIGFYQKVDNINFLQLLKNNEYLIPNKKIIQYIFVFGGYNDGYENQASISNISNEINNFVIYCKQNYPNAKIVIGEIGYDVNRNSDGSNRRNNLNSKVIPAYANSSYDINYPFMYLPNLNYCLHNLDLMASDGVHPNFEGHKKIANAIYNAFNKGYYQQTINEEYVSCSPYIENSVVNAELYVTNKIPVKTIRFNRFYVNFNDLATFDHNNGTVIAKFDNSKLIIPTYSISFKTTALFRNDQNNYTVCPIILIFENNYIKIKLELLNQNRDNWEILSNIEYLEISSQELLATMDIL